MSVKRFEQTMSHAAARPVPLDGERDVADLPGSVAFGSAAAAAASMLQLLIRVGGLLEIN
jgi:hypothetical protein